MVDLYALLDITANASDEEVKRAFRRKAKIYHPDVNNSRYAQEKFVKIQQAYELLIDKEKRFAYDQKRTATKNPYDKYESWLNAQKEKQEKAEKRKYQDFIRRKEDLRRSKLYYPYKIALHFVSIFLSGICLSVLLFCAIAIIKFHVLLFFFLLPFICVAAFVLKYTIDSYRTYRALF